MVGRIVRGFCVSVVVTLVWASLNLVFGVAGGPGTAIRLALWAGFGCAAGYWLANYVEPEGR